MDIKCVRCLKEEAEKKCKSESERHTDADRDGDRASMEKMGRIKDDHKRRNKQDATQSNST